MATAIAVGSLLSSTAGAASTAGIIGATGIGGISFGTLSAGFGILGQVMGGFEQSAAAEAEAESSRQAAEFRAIESESQAAREKTAAAIEGLEREKSLRATLAAQRARFGGSGIDPFSGSPARISEVTESEIKRQDRQAGLFSSLTVSSLNRQAQQDRLSGEAAVRAGKAKSSAAKRKAFSGAMSQAKDLGSLIK